MTYGVKRFAGKAFAALLILIGGVGCSHLSSEERYPSKAQVVRFTECDKLEGLRQFEIGLFQAGFLRSMVREDEPVPFELSERLVAAEPKLIEYSKSDFEAVTTRESVPYREIRNRYKIAACEEPGGALYLVIVRPDPDSNDQFLGTRLNAALKASGCRFTTVAPPREIGLFRYSTEDDILRHIQRGRCQDYATAK